MGFPDPMTLRYEEAFGLHDEARMTDSDELTRTAALEMYNLIFQDTERTKDLLRGAANMIKIRYDQEGNSKVVKYLKKVGKKIYFNFVRKKEMLSGLDKLLNNNVGLE